MGGLLLSFGLKFLTSGALSTITNYLKARSDAGVVKYTQLVATMISTMTAEVELRKVQAQVLTVAMGHPIFWLGWICFVLPTAVYYGAILFVSIFDSSLNPAGCMVPGIGDLLPSGRSRCPYYVRRIPELQEAWANNMVMFIFGGQIVTGGFNAIINRLLPSLAAKA